MSNFTRFKSLSEWRKLSLALWKQPNDPTIYGFDEFNAENLLQFRDRLNQNTDDKITITHIVAKALSQTLEQYPAANAIVNWGHLYQRKTVDIFLQVAVPNPNSAKKHHLSGVKITDTAHKTIQEISKELCAKSQKIREKNDKDFSKAFSVAKKIPVFFLRRLTRFYEFLGFNLGLHMPKLGLRHDPFGSAMITNVGSLGLPGGFAPLVPTSRTPLIIAIGAVKKKAWVVDEKLAIKPVMGLGITADHRVIDGLHAAKMYKIFFDILNDPEKFIQE